MTQNRTNNHLFSIIEYILNNTPCDQYILLFDCNNIGMEYIIYLPKIINHIKILKDNFPERLKNLLLLNSSCIVNNIYDAIKVNLNERIQKKVIFIKDNDEINNYCPSIVSDIISNMDYDDIQIKNIL